MKEYAYDDTKLPAAYKGGNIRIIDRHYSVGSGDELTKWDEHPWSTATYVKEAFAVCGVDKAAPKNCTYCAKMHDPEQKARLARARTNRKNYEKATKK